MTTPATADERISRLEGAFQAFSVMVNNMVTREEMQAHLATIMAGFDSLRSEMRISDESLRTEMRASDESLRSELRSEMRASNESLRTELRAEMRASNESLRAEMRAEIRAAFAEERAERRASEIRNTRWIIGAIFAATTLAVAAIKLIP